MAPNDEHNEALQVDIFGLPGDAKRPRQLMGTTDKVVLRLQQEISSNLENLSKLSLEKDQLRAALGEAQAETAQLRESDARLQRELASSLENLSKLSHDAGQLQAELAEREAEAARLRAVTEASK